jgi:pSer/pThr/pTyr-binding forkhead associated (FHA) protein
MWLLRALDGNDHGTFTFRLEAGAVKTIGRAKRADFCVDAPLVSRLHCRVSAEDADTVGVVDLGSTNGTWIDGERVSEGTLAEGRRLRVGRVEFVLERHAGAPA